MTKLLILPENLTGRDFVVGDLHGMFSALKKAMRFHRFNYTKDRLLCTGDLVDRGPESLELLEYLHAPWFYSVLGNHDTKLLARHNFEVAYVSQRKAFAHLEDKEWWDNPAEKTPQINSRQHRLAEILPILHSLPLMIFVEGQHPYAICHGQRPSRDGKGVEPYTDTEILQNPSILTECENEITWGRQVHNSFRAGDNPLKAEDIRRTFVGHNIVKQLEIFEPYIFIDVGTYKSGKVHLFDAVSVLNGAMPRTTRQTRLTQ
jgi:serine/threonine protein phosphatase 1